LALAAVVIVALGVTSTRWFCAEGCHKVQDDSILAYEASVHANISCMACHMPAGADPITFIFHKAEALGELYLTVRDDFELPLNGASHVSLTMNSKQCTQCHKMENRVVTPSAGIKIDHAVHAEFNTACTVCHNRVAHVENFELTLTDPKSGEPNRPHTDFMSMQACFRCHGLEDSAAATGRCAACHTPGFNLMPENHEEDDFFPAGHGKLAKEAEAEVEAALASASGEEHSVAPSINPLAVQKAYASSAGGGEPVSFDEVPGLIEEQREHGADPMVTIGSYLPRTEAVFYCATCHRESFCKNCHDTLTSSELFR
jgi:hypothetical protein